MNKNIINICQDDLYFLLKKYYNSKSSSFYKEKYNIIYFINLIIYSFNKINFNSKKNIYKNISSYLEEDYKEKKLPEEEYKNIRKLYYMLAKELSFIKTNNYKIIDKAMAILAGSISKYDNMIYIGDKWNEL